MHVRPPQGESRGHSDADMLPQPPDQIFAMLRAFPQKLDARHIDISQAMPFLVEGAATPPKRLRLTHDRNKHSFDA